MWRKYCSELFWCKPDLLTVAKKVPHAVFCLLTALAFYRLTTQIAHAVEVAKRSSSCLYERPFQIFTSRDNQGIRPGWLRTHVTDN